MRTVLILSISLALLLHMCCSRDDGRPADMPKLYPVTISIIQDGVPLDGATVTLISKTPSTYGTASATTVAGTARPRTYGFDGVPAGDYTVLVEKRVTEGEREITQEGIGVVGTIGGRVYQLVNTQFTTQATTPLGISVAERRGATETFDVGTAIRVFLFEHTSSD